MRRVILCGTTLMLLFAAAGQARAAEGPAGTSEGTQDEFGTWSEDNQLDCGEAEADDVDLGNGLMLKTQGDQAAPQEGGAVVVCNEGGNQLPIQGRVIASGGTEGGYVAVDGDADNPSEQSQGYARADASGAGPTVRCGDVATNDTDAANPGPGAAQANCG